MQFYAAFLFQAFLTNAALSSNKVVVGAVGAILASAVMMMRSITIF